MLVTKGFYFKVFVNKKETLAALTDFVLHFLWFLH